MTQEVQGGAGPNVTYYSALSGPSSQKGGPALYYYGLYMVHSMILLELLKENADFHQVFTRVKSFVCENLIEI